MKKVFISQPMKGRTNEQIEKEREDAIAEVKSRFSNEEIEVIDSFFKDAPHDAKPLWFLGKSLELLSTADIAYFASGWKDARGCRIEHTCAVEYNIPFILERNELLNEKGEKNENTKELSKQNREHRKRKWNI